METEATTLSSTARTTGDMSGAEAGRVLWRRLTIPAPRHSRTDALHPIHNISRYEKSFSVFRNRNCGTVPGGNRVILPDLALKGGLSSWSPRANWLSKAGCPAGARERRPLFFPLCMVGNCGLLSKIVT